MMNWDNFSTGVKSMQDSAQQTVNASYPVVLLLSCYVGVFGVRIRRGLGEEAAWIATSNLLTGVHSNKSQDKLSKPLYFVATALLLLRRLILREC